jgi:hypothetical protein
LAVYFSHHHVKILVKKTVKERGRSLQTISIKYCKIHDYYSENGIITDIKINNTSIVSKRTFSIVHKGKAFWTYPEGSRRLRFPDFKTIGTLRW